MSDEIDKEITTRKVTSDLNTPVEEHRVSEQRTTKVTNNSDNALGLVLVILIPLAIGGAVAAYFFNNRPVTPTQIVVPSATEPVKDNKSTVIERNTTTIKEVSPSSPQATPRVQVNVPAATVQPQPAAPNSTIILQQPPSNPAPAPTVSPTIILQQPANPAPAPNSPTVQPSTQQIQPRSQQVTPSATPVQPATPVPSARPVN